MLCKKCRKEIPEESVYCMWCGRKQVQAERIKRRPNGTGTVYKMAGSLHKPWRAVVSKGKRRIQVGYYATQTEALKAIAAFELPGSSVRSDMTLEDVYEAWSATKDDTISKSTQDVYKAAWKNMESIRHLQIAEIRTQDYQQIVDNLKKTKSRSTCTKVKILASQLCKWAVQNDIIDRNYAEFIVLPAEKNEEEKKYFTEEEIRILWDARDDYTARIVLVMIYTGFRINELFSIKVEDVHIDVPVTKDRTVSYMIGGEKTEAGKNRTVAIHSKILPFIKEWVSEKGRRYLIECVPSTRVRKDGTIYTAENKHLPMEDHNFRSRSYYPLLDKLGIERISPHKARHTFATRGARSGISQVVLQNLLGHANYETTADYYTHVDLLQLADGIEMIDQ